MSITVAIQNDTIKLPQGVHWLASLSSVRHKDSWTSGSRGNIPWLLGTNVWIHYLKNPGSRIEKRLADRHPDEIVTCAVTRREYPVD